ncbi:MAG: DUF1365 domain-containing protein [Planctomycetes bacterium]|nr:DUF1365 domain-containing protein [Planctomycetota bacterium]
MNGLQRSHLFEGKVRHRRYGEKAHRFEYRLGLFLLDLEDIPDLRRTLPWWGVAWGPRSFRREDYFQPETPCLRQAVLDRVESELGVRPDGAVRLLTQLRSTGYAFNPVSFYFCHDRDGRLQAVMAEITNTPWRERHVYVLPVDAQTNNPVHRWTFAKTFHVSPFFGMEQNYHWAIRLHGDSLAVTMWNEEAGRRVFDASLVGHLSPAHRNQVRRSAWRAPWQGQRLHLAIFWQAFRLWRKRVTFHSHPQVS